MKAAEMRITTEITEITEEEVNFGSVCSVSSVVDVTLSP